MSDVKCPTCGQEQDINHDEGYGLEDDGEFEQECELCYTEFTYVTYVSRYYNVFCGERCHDLVQSKYVPNLYRCKNCDYSQVGDKQGDR